VGSAAPSRKRRKLACKRRRRPDALFLPRGPSYGAFQLPIALLLAASSVRGRTGPEADRVATSGVARD
jgi:hypothetical protein